MNKTDTSIELLKQDPSTSFSSHKFKKRSLNWKNFQQLLYRMIMSMKTMGKVSGLSKEFMERIMLAVTSVNECRYCTYYHTKIALESGCSDDEVREILGGDFSCADQKSCQPLHLPNISRNPMRNRVEKH